MLKLYATYNRTTKSVRIDISGDDSLFTLKSRIQAKFSINDSSIQLYTDNEISDSTQVNGKRIIRIEIEQEDVVELQKDQLIFVIDNKPIAKVIDTYIPTNDNDFNQHLNCISQMSQKDKTTITNTVVDDNLSKIKYNIHHDGFCWLCDTKFPSFVKNRNAKIMHFKRFHKSVFAYCSQMNPNPEDMPQIQKGAEKRQTIRSKLVEKQKQNQKRAQQQYPLHPTNPLSAQTHNENNTNNINTSIQSPQPQIDNDNDNNNNNNNRNILPAQPQIDNDNDNNNNNNNRNILPAQPQIDND
eukprot:225559_1